MRRVKAFAREWMLPRGIYRVLKDSSPKIKRMWGGKSPGRPPTVYLEPSGQATADLFDLQTCPYGRILWVETERLFAKSGRPFSWQQHPFVRYYKEGEEVFARYYQLHQPRNQIELVMLDPASVGKFVPVTYPNRRKPWDFETQYSGDGGLDATHGDKYQGPASTKKLLFEMKRLDLLRKSVEKSGFRVVGGDHIRFGELLINDEASGQIDYRVGVSGGEHRTSLLSHLGWQLIPMVPNEGLRWREVRLSNLRHWPGVLDGTFSEDAARQFFLAHFRSTTDRLLPGW